MVKTSPFAQMLWTCTKKVKELSHPHWEGSCGCLLLPPALCACQRRLPQLWWQNETQLPLNCFNAKSKSLIQAAPIPLGILCFKHWILSWSSLELSVFSVCWLRCVGGILWETGNILNRHSYFQNNHFHASLATEAGINFASFRLV